MFQFFRGIKAIAIDMPDSSEAAFFNRIFLRDREGGADDSTLVAQAPNKTFGKGGFTGAEVARKGDNYGFIRRIASFYNLFRQISGEGGRFFFGKTCIYNRGHLSRLSR